MVGLLEGNSLEALLSGLTFQFLLEISDSRAIKYQGAKAILLAPAFMGANLRDNSLAPAGLFIQADTQNSLCHHLMREEGIRGMYSAQTRIADQSFVTRRAKNSIAAGHFQPQVHDAPGTFD